MSDLNQQQLARSVFVTWYHQNSEDYRSYHADKNYWRKCQIYRKWVYIQENLINTTPTRPDYFLFLQESQAKVLTNQSKHLFQNKNKRPRCIKVGNGPLKYSLCGKYCNYLLTTTQSDRFASCEHFVSLSQTSSIPPWNKPILDIPKSERSIVYRIRKWPMDSKLKIIIYCLSWWTPHLRPHSENDFLSFSLIICFFCCQSRIVVGLVVSESRVPSLYFLGGIFTR